MKESDLAQTLRTYRDEKGLSPKQMAEQLALSETDYERMEAGTLVPTPEEELKYRYALIDEGGAPEKSWYQSRKWHWLIPIVIGIGLSVILMYSEGFHAGYGRDAVAHPPYRFFTLLTLLICLIYWCFWRPQWPFQRKVKH